jgi:hypothetical protein
MAAEAVGKIGFVAATDEIIAILVNLLKEKTIPVCRGAVYAIGQIGSAAATDEILDLLLCLLEDKNDSLRSAAARALVAMMRHGVRLFRQGQGNTLVVKRVTELAAYP